MKNGFVASTSDILKLHEVILSQLKGEQIICSSLQDVEKLHRADAVFFVTSEVSLLSTGYQELVLAALDAIEESNRWLLRLDRAEMPLGFAMLRSLPEGAPK